MKILMLAHKMPYPLHDGGSQAIFHNALGFIHQNVNVKMLALNTPKDWAKINDFPQEFINRSDFESVSVDTRIQPHKAFANLFSNRSYFVERFYSNAYEKRLTAILSEEKFDVVQLEHLYMCLYLPAIRAHSTAKVILRSQNVEHILRERYLKMNNSFFTGLFLKIATRRLAVYEKKATNLVDGIVALTDKDAKVFKSMTNDIPIATIPLGYDLSGTGRPDLQAQPLNSNVIYHLGSMDWLPNIQGVDWFIKEVLPLIVEKLPGIQFRIAGKKMPEKYYFLANKNLIVDGEVKNAHEYQSDKYVLIVPLLAGGGIRVKIIEGLALGKTIISTSIGAEGIPVTHDKNILIADTPREFVDQIFRAVTSGELRMKIGANAKELARKEFHCAEVAGKVLIFFKKIMDR